MLVADLRTNKTQGHEILHLQATEIARRFWEGDASLAHELIQHTSSISPSEPRASSCNECSQTQSKQRAEPNAMPITGKTAQEIKKVRG